MDIITGLSPEQLFAGSLPSEGLPTPPPVASEAPSSAAAPVMEEPPATQLRLPRGLHHEGAWHTDVVIRELTGVDEETLGRFTSNFLDRWEVLIALGIESIGPVTFSDKPLAERRELSLRLLSGERMMIFLAVIGATFGDTRTFTFTCRECAAEMETDVLVSQDLKAVSPEDGYGTHSYTFTTRTGDQLGYRLPTGSDERDVLDQKNLNDGERNTQLLIRILQKVNGRTPLDPEGYLRGLSISDRRALLTEINKYQPSIDFSMDISCVKCGHPNHFEIEPLELFRF